ncbi:hypothetical protein C8R47DRAFT_1074435 [Mycena vitilis]|nr:hypothetical protein C8R47DRAFT_1074435 [Mycena vitilis]
MDDAHFCSGDVNGTQCRCRRFIRNSDSDPRCGCEHPEGYHPDPAPRTSASSIPSIVASYLTPKTILNPPSNAVASSSSAVASSSNTVASSSARRPPASSGSTSENSAAIALAETNKGLKRKANHVEGTGSGGSRKKLRKAADSGFPLTQPSLKQRAAVDGKEIIMGEIIIMVTKANDTARKTFTTPPRNEVARWENFELTVNGMRTKLSFGVKWDARRMDQLFREKFPQFFAYTDEYFPLDPTADPEEFHWDLLIRTGKTLTVAPRVSPDGHEFLRWAGPSGVRTADRKIWLASRHRISPDVWDHKSGVWIFNAPIEFDDPTESDAPIEVDAIESESDHYSSMEIESDGSWKGSVASSQRPSKSKKSRGKEKAKAKSQSPDLALFSAFDMEAEEEEEDFEFPVSMPIDDDLMPFSVTGMAAPAPSSVVPPTAPLTGLPTNAPSTGPPAMASSMGVAAMAPSTGVSSAALSTSVSSAPPSTGRRLAGRLAPRRQPQPHPSLPATPVVTLAATVAPASTSSAPASPVFPSRTTRSTLAHLYSTQGPFLQWDPEFDIDPHFWTRPEA